MPIRPSRWALCALLLAQPALAQVRVDALTEVHTIRFSGARSLSEHTLRERLRTRDRGWSYGVRVALGKIPFVPGPGPRPFSPLELQQDVVRLREAYTMAGFVQAQVRYTVERDDQKNLLDITFEIEEGRPLMIAEVEVTAHDSLAALPVAAGDRRSWKRLERSVLAMKGRRLDVAKLRDGRDRLTQWWRNRGHPLAQVSTRVRTDSARFELGLAYRVTPGPWARFGDVTVEGNQLISDATALRQVPIDAGERYSVKALEDTRVSLQELDIVRMANVDVPSLGSGDTTAATSETQESTAVVAVDSLLPVRVRISEAEPRLVNGALGYVTDGGLSSDARWSHRNFTGGGRTLAVTGLAQTGWLAVTENPDIRYRLAVSLKQPGFMDRRLSAVLSPFVEYRDDIHDRSTQYGVNTTLLYHLMGLRSVSLDYKIARRDVHEYRFEDLATGEIDLLTFLTQASQGLLDSLGSALNTSTFTLSGHMGGFDDPANPRLGVVVRPAIQITAPDAWSSTAYSRLDVTATTFTPLGRVAVLAGRFTFGRLYPFGKSLPENEAEQYEKFLQLRDVSFTAGGTVDVRGWENRMLGPKVPDVRFSTVGDSLVPRTEGYVPFGGFERQSFSLELQFRLPALGPNFGTHVFLDGGRVRTDDARFGLEGDPNSQERLFVATGAGLDLRTPVGPIKIGVGYKLNPSLTDLVDASDLALAAEEGRPFDELPRHNSRRWQWHLAIGTSY